jgi:rRNA-processing protein FCF1
MLHFKPISEIGPDELKIGHAYTWLIVGQVFRELDIRKGTGDKTLRKRARKASKELEQAEAQKTSLASGCGVQVHFRTKPFDFESKGLLPNEGDDKIIADILDFKSEHRDDEVLLLSDDASMRMRARTYHIPTIDPGDIDPEGILKRPEIEDERDEQLRQLRESYREHAETQPRITFGFQDGTRELMQSVSSFA